jgi:hypothetical protein
MSDTTKVCALCAFYDDTSMDCERFPPSVKHTFVNDDGDDDAHWYQPFILHPWTTRCGEWQEINDPIDNRNHPDHDAAVARLKLIVQSFDEKNKDNKEENNAPRDGTGNG